MEINQLIVGNKYWLRESFYAPVRVIYMGAFPYTLRDTSPDIEGVYYIFKADTYDFTYRLFIGDVRRVIFSGERCEMYLELFSRIITRV